MKVIDAVKICGEILNLSFSQELLNDVPQALKDDGINKLLRCCNVTLEELYRDKFGDCNSAVIKVSNSKADIASLGLCKVISLTDAKGNAVAFRYCKNGLFVHKDGAYVLHYAKLPAVLELNSEIELPSPRLSYRIFVYGVVKEYYFESGDLDLYGVWNEKYLDALKVASEKTGGLTLPVGRWL